MQNFVIRVLSIRLSLVDGDLHEIDVDFKLGCIMKKFNYL